MQRNGENLSAVWCRVIYKCLRRSWKHLSPSSDIWCWVLSVQVGLSYFLLISVTFRIFQTFRAVEAQEFEVSPKQMQGIWPWKRPMNFIFGTALARRVYVDILKTCLPISWCLVSDSLLWRFVQVMVLFSPFLLSVSSVSSLLQHLVLRFHTPVVVHSIFSIILVYPPPSNSHDSLLKMVHNPDGGLLPLPGGG